jgi:hypothetical protein
MKKIITQIRDIDLIEKELKSNSAGIFSFLSKDRICQTAATYVYLNKNVFLFINENEEFHLNIKADSEAAFAILKHDTKKLIPRGEFTPSYSLFSISISGTVRNVSDQKLIDESAAAYFRKYGKEPENRKIQELPAVKIILIDTQEIQAFEEIGG